jgi:WD40 repeat protein
MFSLINIRSETPKLCTMQSAISPDGTHILGGSSDGNVYLWQVLVADPLPAFLHYTSL